MNFQRGQVKREVREAMKHTRPRPIWVTLFFLFIVALVSGVINTAVTFLAGGGILTSPDLMGAMFSGNYDTIVSNTGPAAAVPPGTAIYMTVVTLLGALLTNLWQSSMDVGYTDYCMDMVRGRNPGIDKLFSMIRMAWPIIVTQFLVCVFATLWSILFSVIGLIIIGVGGALMSAFPTLPIIGILLMIAGVAAMLLGMLWAVLRYAMVNYLIVDQGISGLAAIRESKRLMRGHLLQFVWLHLSFIIWYLPGFIGSGILGARMAAMAGAAASDAVVGAFDSSYMMQAVYDLMGAMALFGLFLLIQMVLNLYLTPYVTGTVSRFYFWLTGADVSAPRQDWTPPMPPVNGPENSAYTWTDEFSSSGQGTYSGTGYSAPPARPLEPPRELPQQPAAPDVPEAPANAGTPEDPWDKPDDSSAKPEGPEE